MLLTLIAIAIVAYFVGTRIERAREVHSNFNNYKRRVASMRGVRWRVTTQAIVGVVALIVLLDIVFQLV